MAIRKFQERQQTLPRVGKIHLGRKVPNKSGKGEHPEQVDYFVVRADDTTPEWAAEAFKVVYGETPRELTISFPTDDPRQWADETYKAYTRSGKICQGDGETAVARWMSGDGPRPPEMTEGTWATNKSQPWQFRSIPCHGEECPLQQANPPMCKMTMPLMFLLPEVKGLGVWQIDTGSVIGISEVQKTVRLILSLPTARIRGLPLKLSLVAREMSPPGVPARTGYVLHLAAPTISLNEVDKVVAQLAAGPSATPAVLPSVASGFDDEDAPDDYEEETLEIDGQTIDIGTGQIVESKPLNAIATGEAMTAKEAPPAGVPALANIGSLLTWAWNDCRLKSGDVCTILGVDTTDQINDLPDAYEKIRQHMEGKQASLSVP